MLAPPSRQGSDGDYLPLEVVVVPALVSDTQERGETYARSGAAVIDRGLVMTDHAARVLSADPGSLGEIPDSGALCVTRDGDMAGLKRGLKKHL